jgi:hypothetical protein
MPESNKSFITTTLAKRPQSAIKSPQQANWRNSVAQFCELETKPAQACESPTLPAARERESARSRDRTRV